ncbi:hypothetical protein GCM10007424_14770 [Flavobacterium suaedae]|uniref:DUF5683 domain-containing protein n=1 Tax=Flavobacterium suaedae TaxID=1767027 RepID=A0ABQ1JWI6_9FLAO|nr:DUF5683 domain-containing protein [Flavobacterium suaedae]GGB75856.1 hypothetical protein GCM10007424_14770 [Flavobacterium suaedae]
MKKRLFIYTAFLAFSSASLFAQNQDADDDLKTTNAVTTDSIVASSSYVIDPLAPSKAAFYSAIVPGLGQVYNKSYWKVPIVYGSMGLSMYYYSFNNTEYHRYRDAYRDRLAGRPVTGELAELSNDRLISGQRFHQRNRDLSLLITVGLYILNIVEANVDAHLAQFNVNENLSFHPTIEQTGMYNTGLYNTGFQVGMTMSYKF